MGCSPPVLPWRSPNAWPFRYSFPSPSPKTRRFGPSSPGVRSSYTVFPEVPALDLSVESTSPGVCAPSALTGSESPRPSRFPGPAPRRFLAGNPPAGPTPPVTVPFTGFLNLSTVSSSPRLPAFFRQVALLGFSLQGFTPSTKPRRLVAAGIPS